MGWTPRVPSLIRQLASVPQYSPASPNIPLEIRTALKSLGGRSGVVRQEVALQGTDTLVADADVTFVVVSLRDGKAVAMEGELREVLGGMLEVPAASAE